MLDQRYCVSCGDALDYDSMGRQPKGSYCPKLECQRERKRLNKREERRRAKEAEQLDPNSWAALTDDDKSRYWIVNGAGAVLGIDWAYSLAKPLIDERLRPRHPALYVKPFDFPPGEDFDWAESTAQAKAIELEYARWQEFERILDESLISAADDWDGLIPVLDGVA